MGDRLLVLVPHEHTHAPRSILEQARKLGPDVTEMRAIKHTMELIAHRIANGALTKEQWKLGCGDFKPHMCIVLSSSACAGLPYGVHMRTTPHQDEAHEQCHRSVSQYEACTPTEKGEGQNASFTGLLGPCMDLIIS